MMGLDAFDGDVNPRQIAMMLRNPSKLAGMLSDDVPGVGSSGAAIFADVVNVERADLKRLAEEHDVEVEIGRMSEDRAADLIAGIIDGRGADVVEVFNELAEQRDMILREVLDDDDYQEFMDAKTSRMLTDDPDTFDDDGAGDA